MTGNVCQRPPRVQLVSWYNFSQPNKSKLDSMTVKFKFIGQDGIHHARVD